MSKVIDFELKGQGSGAQAPLACVFSDCGRRTDDEQPLPFPRRATLPFEPAWICISTECTF